MKPAVVWDYVSLGVNRLVIVLTCVGFSDKDSNIYKELFNREFRIYEPDNNYEC